MCFIVEKTGITDSSNRATDFGDKSMKILDILDEKAILVDLKSADKKGVLDELVDPIASIAGLDHDEWIENAWAVPVSVVVSGYHTVR